MKANTGFTLVEILLVLGVLSLLALAVFVIYPRVMLAAEVENDRTSIRGSISNMISAYALTGRNFGSNNDGSNISPLPMTLKPLQCDSPVPGSVDPTCVSSMDALLSASFFSTYSGTGVTAPMLQYTFQDMSPEQCTQFFGSGGGLASMNAQSAMIMGVNGGTTAIHGFNLLSTPTQIIETCNSLPPSSPDGSSFNTIAVISDPFNTNIFSLFIGCTTSTGICQ
jgi:prepilin-type N-terminal cleavage/methylation domain-containing protein